MITMMSIPGEKLEMITTMLKLIADSPAEAVVILIALLGEFNKASQEPRSNEELGAHITKILNNMRIVECETPGPTAVPDEMPASTPFLKN